MMFLGNVICDATVSLFISLYLADLFPARPGKARLRLFLSMIMAVMLGFTNNAASIGLFAIPGLVSNLGTIINNIFRLWIFYKLTNAIYSQYLITFLVIGRLYGCYFNIFTSLAGTSYFLLTYSALYIQYLAIFAMIATAAAIKKVFTYEGDGLYPGIFFFYLVMFLIVLIFSATTFFNDLHVKPEGASLPISIAIIITIIFLAILLFGIGIFLYQRHFKKTHEKQLQQWEMDLDDSRVMIEKQETQLRRQRHDQINLTGTLLTLLKNQDIAEAKALVQEILIQPEH